jgi:hypothetical protein
MKTIILILVFCLVSAVSFAANSKTKHANPNPPWEVEATIDTAPGDDGYWTDPIESTHKNRAYLSVWVDMSDSSTVTIQKRTPEGSGWKTIKTYTEDTYKYIFDDEAGVDYRIGVDNGDLAAGDTVWVRLGR